MPGLKGYGKGLNSGIVETAKKKKKKKKVEAGSYNPKRRKGYEQMLEDAGKIP